MRRCAWMPVVLAVLAVLVAGCGLQRGRTTSLIDRLRQLGGPAGEDVVFLEIVLLERPAGDAFINHEVWATTDEQVIDLNGKAKLEDNGFRVAQVGGLVPPGLQSLLTSERANANPRRRQCRAGNPTVIALSPPYPTCRYRLSQDGTPAEVALEQAVCGVQVTPGLTDDNRVRLSFVPQVQHGERKGWPQPAEDGTGWTLQGQKPVERYPGLAWEVTLAANEYAVVGTRFGRPETLGYQCFVALHEANPVQRLLVVRAGRMAGVPVAGSDFPAGRPAGPDVTPLALQATVSSARGCQK